MLIGMQNGMVCVVLCSLGFGEVKAQAIIDYRHQHGLFHNASELTKVEGISIATCEEIRHLITVAD